MGNHRGKVAHPCPERFLFGALEDSPGPSRGLHHPVRGRRRLLPESLETYCQAKASFFGKPGEARSRRYHRDRRRSGRRGSRGQHPVRELLDRVGNREARDDRARGFGKRPEPHGDPRDGAQGPERAGEELGQLVTRHVLHDPPAGSDAGPGGQHRRQAEQEIPGTRPGDHPEPGVARGDHASEGRPFR